LSAKLERATDVAGIKGFEKFEDRLARGIVGHGKPGAGAAHCEVHAAREQDVSWIENASKAAYQAAAPQ
jgi:hypothetical protein